MTDDKDPGRDSLAAKLNHLFATIYPRGRGEYTHEEVARAISERGGVSVSHTYVWQLRRGIKTNPSMAVLEALSQFFGVSPGYFFHEETAARVDAQLDLLRAIRDTDVRRLTLRASDLSAESLRTVTEMVERLRELEGLADDPEKQAPERRNRTSAKREDKP